MITSMGSGGFEKAFFRHFPFKHQFFVRVEGFYIAVFFQLLEIGILHANFIALIYSWGPFSGHKQSSQHLGRKLTVFSFLPKAQAAKFGGGADVLTVANPISEELNQMRPSIISTNILQIVALCMGK